MNHEARCAGPAQVAQARTILSRMAALQAEAGRPTWVMLAGDFNSVPGSAIYRCSQCAAKMLLWHYWQFAMFVSCAISIHGEVHESTRELKTLR